MPKTLKNYKIVITSHAEDSMKEIYEFIKERVSTEFAALYEQRIMEAVLKFDNPFLWPQCPELPTKSKRYRHIVFKNYRIIGKVVQDEVYILDVFHTKRNPSQLRKLRRIKL